jgi:hypothetical protein
MSKSLFGAALSAAGAAPRLASSRSKSPKVRSSGDSKRLDVRLRHDCSAGLHSRLRHRIRGRNAEVHVEREVERFLGGSRRDRFFLDRCGGRRDGGRHRGRGIEAAHVEVEHVVVVFGVGRLRLLGLHRFEGQAAQVEVERVLVVGNGAAAAGANASGSAGRGGRLRRSHGVGKVLVEAHRLVGGDGCGGGRGGGRDGGGVEARRSRMRFRRQQARCRSHTAD